MDNAEKDLEQLHELCDKIKERLVALGINDFVLFAADYWDEYEDWAEDFEIDEAGEYGFYVKEVQVGDSWFTTYVRKIKIKDDDLVFDLEEIEANDDSGYSETVGSDENMSIDVITDSAHSDNTKTVLRCLKSILDYAFDEDNPDIIELNKRRYE